MSPLLSDVSKSFLLSGAMAIRELVRAQILCKTTPWLHLAFPLGKGFWNNLSIQLNWGLITFKIKVRFSFQNDPAKSHSLKRISDKNCQSNIHLLLGSNQSSKKINAAIMTPTKTTEQFAWRSHTKLFTIALPLSSAPPASSSLLSPRDTRLADCVISSSAPLQTVSS